MAEKQGFLRRIFSFASAPEEQRVPEQGEAPRPADTLVGSTPGAPDPDLHQVAAADTATDSEAGASDGGGIEPLKPREAPSDSPAGGTHGSTHAPEAQPGMAEKKTSPMSRSRWNG